MNSEFDTLMSFREWGMVVILSIVWGGSFFFVGVVVDDLPPLSIVVVRVGLAAIALQVIVYLRGASFLSHARYWREFVGMGLLNNAIPFSLIVWGQGHIASGLASILNATTPIFTVVVAHYLISDERMTFNKIIGVTLGFGGVIVMIGPELVTGLGNNLLAQFAILGAALSYAFAGAFGRRFKRLGVPPVTVATGQVTASTILLLPLCLWLEQPWTLPIPGVQTLLSLVALALISTAFAYILFFKILAAAGATNLSLVTLLVPVSAILLGMLVLGENLEVTHFMGMGIIAFGLLAIDGRVITVLTGGKSAAVE